MTAGERYLAIATGFLAPNPHEPAFEINAYAEGFKLDDAANAHLRVVHASPDAPSVDVGTEQSGRLTAVVARGLSFGQATPASGLSLPAASLSIGVAPTGVRQVVAAFGLTTQGGERAFAIAAGALDAHRGVGFRIIAVDTTSSPWQAASVLPR